MPGEMVASITSGTLYINNIKATTTGLINNGDQIQILYRSSSSYDTTVSTIFSV
jgi:hypothetical protein